MSARPMHWPRWSRTWGPVWAGWWHIPRAERRKILADPAGYRDRLAADLPLPGETPAELKQRRLERNEFCCAICRGVFTKGWSEEEADAERAQLFGGVPRENCDLVCDPCFKRMGLA